MRVCVLLTCVTPEDAYNKDILSYIISYNKHILSYMISAYSAKQYLIAYTKLYNKHIISHTVYIFISYRRGHWAYNTHIIRI